jgi:ribosomal protein L18
VPPKGQRLLGSGVEPAWSEVMIKKKYANEARLRRHRRVRKKVSGTVQRPRLSVFRSQNQIYAQIVDDERRTTLVAASSREAELSEIAKSLGIAPQQGGGARRGAASSGAASGGATETAAAPTEGRKRAAARGSAQAAATPEPAEDGKASAIPAAIADNRRIVQARLVGHLVAQRAKAQGIEKVVFDRGGYLYQGRVAALAAGAREGGLDF